MEHTRIAFGIGHTPCGIGRLDPVVLVYGLLVYFDVFCVFKYEERELNFVLLGNYTIHTHIYIYSIDKQINIMINFDPVNLNVVSQH
jgi:hypothetical protein